MATVLRDGQWVIEGGPAAEAPPAAEQAFPEVMAGATPSESQSDVGPVTGVIREALQGAMMGWADEAGGGMRSMVKGIPYDEAVEQVRKEMEAYREANPVAGPTAELAGSLVTGSARIPVAVMQGVIAGMGSADEGSRAQGGALGGGITIGMPKLFQGIGKTASALAQRLGISDSEGLATIMRAIYRDKKTVKEVEDELAKKGPGSILAEGGGENVKALGQSVAVQPGAGREIAKDALATQEAGAHGRIMGATGTAAGTQARAGQTIKEIESRLEKKAKPLYEKAWKEPLKIDKEMNSILKTPLGREAYDSAMMMAENQRRKLPKPSQFDVRAADDVKLGFDRVIEANTDAVTGKINRKGYDALQLKKQWLERVDKYSDNYKKARATYGGEASRRSAVREGQNFLKESAEGTADFLKTATPSEKEMFIVGAVESLRDRIMNSPFPGSAVARMEKTPAMRERLTSLLGKDKTDELLRSFKMEGERREFSNKILGGSRTAPLQQMEKEINTPITAGDIMSAGSDPVATSTGIIGRMLSAGGDNEPRRAAIAKMLFSADPAAHANAFSRLSAKEQKLNQMRKRLLGAGTGTGTFATQETLRQ